MTLVKLFKLSLSLRIHMCEMGVEYVLTSYGVMRIKWICVNALSRCMMHSWCQLLLFQCIYPTANGSQSISAENVQGYIQWPWALGDPLVFSGWGLRMLNVYNTRDGFIQQRIVACTQAPMCTYTLVYTHMPVVSPLRITALFQIFIKTNNVLPHDTCSLPLSSIWLLVLIL